MSKSKQNPLTETLFNIYSTNFSAHASSYEGVFMCPICEQYFGRDALESGELTIEHIIPSSIGGKLKTLTCKVCNNSAGRDLDAHLVNRLRADDKFRGHSERPLRGIINVGEGEFTADITFSDVDLEDKSKPIQIKATPLDHLSNPKLHDLAKKHIEGQIKEEGQVREVGVTFDLQYRNLPSQVALLRSAYLLMFHYFGYGYIKYKFLDQVRDQIRNPDTPTIIAKAIKELPSTPPEKNAVFILSKPEPLQCFFIVLDLSTGIERYSAVVLPGFNPESASIYQRWPESTGEYESSITLFGYNRDWLSNPGYRNAAKQIWYREIGHEDYFNKVLTEPADQLSSRRILSETDAKVPYNTKPLANNKTRLIIQSRDADEDTERP